IVSPSAMLLVAMTTFAGLLVVRHYAGRRRDPAPIPETETVDA
ncbi:amino acid transporter, partial [Tsukamurella pulmonis]